MSEETIIEANNLTKVYEEPGRKVLALSGISLSIKKGEYLALVGPSGAGKSTLIHILGGLDLPTKGEVFFEGKNIKNLSRRELFLLRNKKVGFVFQFYHLIGELTVLENIFLPALALTKNFKTSRKKAEEIAEVLGLSNRLNFYPSQLSGGEQQRVAIGRALINKPCVLFCDEPTGNLDHASSENVRGILKRLNRENNTTLVLVTHNFELAKDAQRVLNIKEGRLYTESPITS